MRYRPIYYMLDAAGERPIGTRDVTAWARWIERNPAHRIVRQERVAGNLVSTAFLSTNHNWGGKGPPILWETMILSGPMAGLRVRCAGNREQAEGMHAHVVKIIRKRLRCTLPVANPVLP